jgi:hypothetical protein
VAVVEWAATATHANPIQRGSRVFPASGKALSWNGIDILPIRDGLVVRKDVYADSASLLAQLDDARSPG